MGTGLFIHPPGVPEPVEVAGATIEAVVFASAGGTRFALRYPPAAPCTGRPAAWQTPDPVAFLTRFVAAVTAFADTGELRHL